MQHQSKTLHILLRRTIAAAVISLPSAHIAAQEQIEFYDDFSADSISYIIDDRPDDRANRSYVVTPERIEMRVSATGNDPGDAYIYISDRTDIVRARLSLSSETDIPADDNGEVKLRISGTWYNEIQDGGLGGNDRTGDVYIQARIRLRGTDRREFSICLDRQFADGTNEGVLLFDGENCFVMPDFDLVLDTVYEVHVALDREAATIAFGIDGREIVTPIGQPVYLPVSNEKVIQLQHEGSSGQAVGMVSAIGTDGDLQDFSVVPLVSGPYRPLFDLQRETNNLTVIGGRVRYEVAAPADDEERLSLTVYGTSDRIEGVIELSSDSVVAAPSSDEDEPFVFARLGGIFYNDTAEGGFNENEGNVFAAIVLKQNSDATREIEYCLFRANTADFSDATELVMQDGTECGDFGISAELDTSYNVGISTDLTAGTVTFSVDDVERIHTITTMVFKPASDGQFISAQARASAGSTAVAYLDDYRTSAAAPLVTTGESADSGGSASSSGSSGCSIGAAGNSRDPLLAVLGLLALGGLIYKRGRRSV